MNETLETAEEQALREKARMTRKQGELGSKETFSSRVLKQIIEVDAV